MSEGYNRVQLLGNLTADPELRFTQSGQAVLNMRMATNEYYLDKDKVRKERVDYHSVVVWGKRGEALAKILQKGSSIFVEGSLRTSSYDDRDGNKRYKTEVVATHILLTGGRPSGDQRNEAPANEGGGRAHGRSAPSGDRRGGGSSSRAAPPHEPDDYDGAPVNDDDIPF